MRRFEGLNVPPPVLVSPAHLPPHSHGWSGPGRHGWAASAAASAGRRLGGAGGAGLPGGGFSLDTISDGLFNSLSHMSSVLTSAPSSTGSGHGAFGGGGGFGGGGFGGGFSEAAAAAAVSARDRRSDAHTDHRDRPDHRQPRHRRLAGAGLGVRLARAPASRWGSCSSRCRSWRWASTCCSRSRGEVKAESKADKERAILNSVMTRGKVSIPDLAIEGNLTRDQVRDYIYDLIGKDLFRGYVNWDRGELVSAEAAQIKDGTCPNCGGHLELAGKGLVRCPYCGTETYLSPPAGGAAAAPARRDRAAAGRAGGGARRLRQRRQPPARRRGRCGTGGAATGRIALRAIGAEQCN